MFFKGYGAHKRSIVVEIHHPEVPSVDSAASTALDFAGYKCCAQPMLANEALVLLTPLVHDGCAGCLGVVSAHPSTSLNPYSEGLLCRYVART